MLRVRSVSRTTVHGLLLLTQVIFGTLPFTGQEAMRSFPPMGVAALRIGGAALVLGLLAGRRLGEMSRRDLPFVALLSMLGLVGNQVLFLEGLSRTTQTNAAVLITTIPVFTALIAVLAGRERISPARLTGIVLALGGALFLVGVERFDLGEARVAGNLMVVGNSLLWSIHLVLARPFLQRVDPGVAIAWMFLLGAVVVLPLGLPQVVAAAPEVSLRGWLTAGYVVLGPTVVTYLIYVWGLRHVEASGVAVYTYVQPVVAGALAVWWAGERFSLRLGLGAAAIFAGVAAVQWAARSARRAAARKEAHR